MSDLFQALENTQEKTATFSKEAAVCYGAQLPAQGLL